MFTSLGYRLQYIRIKRNKKTMANGKWEWQWKFIRLILLSTISDFTSIFIWWYLCFLMRFHVSQPNGFHHSIVYFLFIHMLQTVWTANNKEQNGLTEKMSFPFLTMRSYGTFSPITPKVLLLSSEHRCCLALCYCTLSASNRIQDSIMSQHESHPKPYVSVYTFPSVCSRLSLSVVMQTLNRVLRIVWFSIRATNVSSSKR